MNRKNSTTKCLQVLIVFITSLLSLALFTLPVLGSNPSPNIQLITTQAALEPGTTFDVDVSMIDVNYLWMVDFKLYYNTECLDLIEASPIPPWSLYIIVKNEINDDEGMYHLCMVGLAPASHFDGSATLAEFTFLCTDVGETDFLLADTQLGDPKGRPIPHTTDGLVIKGILVHDVAITHITGYPRHIVQGGIIDVEVEAENQGNFKETFDVTLYADQEKTTIGDEIIIGTQTIYDLPAKETSILHFVWDTAGASYGVYWLSAEASQVPGEIDVIDNFLKAGEYIGGIIPPPHVRQTADLLTQITSTLMTSLIAFAGIFQIKRYWFP